MHRPPVLLKQLSLYCHPACRCLWQCSRSGCCSTPRCSRRSRHCGRRAAARTPKRHGVPRLASTLRCPPCRISLVRHAAQRLHSCCRGHSRCLENCCPCRPLPRSSSSSASGAASTRSRTRSTSSAAHAAAWSRRAPALAAGLLSLRACRPCAHEVCVGGAVTCSQHSMRFAGLARERCRRPAGPGRAAQAVPRSSSRNGRRPAGGPCWEAPGAAGATTVLQQAPAVRQVGVQGAAFALLRRCSHRGACCMRCGTQHDACVTAR